MKYYVEVVEDATGQIVKRIECANFRKSERVHDGVNINLNHAEYSTRIVDEKGKEQ